MNEEELKSQSIRGSFNNNNNKNHSYTWPYTIDQLSVFSSVCVIVVVVCGMVNQRALDKMMKIGIVQSQIDLC